MRILLGTATRCACTNLKAHWHKLAALLGRSRTCATNTQQSATKLRGYCSAAQRESLQAMLAQRRLAALALRAPRAVSSCGRRRCLATAPPSPSPHLIIGTYSIDTGYATGHAHGAYIAALDAATGALTLVGSATGPDIGTNPAYAAHCSAKNAVYFTNEVVDGVIKAYSLSEDGALRFTNEMPSGGEGPCFIAVAPGDEGNVYCGTTVCLSRVLAIAPPPPL
jgi:hypothetical protein